MLGMQPLTIKNAMAATPDFQDHLAAKKSSPASNFDPATGQPTVTVPAAAARYETLVETFVNALKSERRLNRLTRKGGEIVSSNQSSALSWGKHYTVTLRRPVA